MSSTIKRVYFMDEAWYAAANPMKPGVVAEWSIGVDALTDDGRPDGTEGEVMLVWKPLGMAKGLSWELQAFGDGLPVVVEAGLVELLCAHPDAQPDEMKQVLATAGWVDRTDRVYPRWS